MKFLSALVLSGLIVLAVCGMVSTYDDVMSWILMKDRMVFSGKIVVILLSCPLLIFAGIDGLWLVVFNTPLKYETKIVKILTVVAVASFVVGPLLSVYVGHQVTQAGYSSCDKISWMSPNVYVKHLETCK